MEYRIEKDTMGNVEVPADKYWGAQTQRSKMNFKIGEEASMPKEIVQAFGYLKKAAAITNHALGVLPEEKKDLISLAADEIIEGKLFDQFPLVIWQTGSGTQSNMNVNEVLANVSLDILGHPLGSYDIIHPINHINLHQSTNDVYPTSVKIAAIKLIRCKCSMI